jgi:nicotinate-nucleotide adenylyltransferase
LVVTRAGFDVEPYADDALPEVPAISSTEVRRRLARGDTALPLVPRAVMDYIADKELYR